MIKMIKVDARSIRRQRMNKKNMSLTFKFVENVINFVFREINSDATSLENY